MPNHIVNEVRLHRVEASAARALSSGPERIIDFETLVPLPIHYWPGGVSTIHEKAFPGTHLDAARAMWGTKWNAYALSDDSFREDAGDIVLTFETAWSPPRGWIVALFNTLKCDITHYWQDEGSDAVHLEKYVFDGKKWSGPQWDSEEVEHGSADYRRIYKLQWGVETPEELNEE